MLVIAMETGSRPGGCVRWSGRCHDDDRPDASSGASAAELFETVFGALHDGEQVALGFDCPLSVPVSVDQGRLRTDGPGLAELGHLLDELGIWRPWTTVCTSLARWRANISILVWQAVPAPGLTAAPASAAVESFFRHPPAVSGHPTDPDADPADADAAAGPVVNLAAAAARKAGLLVDAAELSRPVVSITVTGW